MISDIGILKLHNDPDDESNDPSDREMDADDQRDFLTKILMFL
jgi:hypothetical protein